MNKEVTAYIQKTQPWQQEVCGLLRTMVHDVVADIEERLQYGKPHFLKDGSYLAVMHVGKDKVSFMIFNAKDIEAPGLLRPMGNGERKVADITDGQTVDYRQLASLLAQAA